VNAGNLTCGRQVKPFRTSRAALFFFASVASTSKSSFIGPWVDFGPIIIFYFSETVSSKTVILDTNNRKEHNWGGWWPCGDIETRRARRLVCEQ
jgi:hypothetical protein